MNRHKASDPRLYKQWGDIPLRDAMLTWDDCFCSTGMAMAVVPHPEPHDSEFKLTCYARPEGATSKERIIWLYSEIWGIVCRDLLPLEMVHNAVSVIPEFRSSTRWYELYEDYLNPKHQLYAQAALRKNNPEKQQSTGKNSLPGTLSLSELSHKYPKPLEAWEVTK